MFTRCCAGRPWPRAYASVTPLSPAAYTPHRIRAVVDTNILFRGLGEVEKNVIVDAMERKTFEPVCDAIRSLGTRF